MSAGGDARSALAHAQIVCPADDVQRAVRRVAASMTAAYAGRRPLLLVVMQGALVFAGQLLPLLDFALDVDYLHVTRYGDDTAGGALQWKSFPETPLAEREVVLIDDVLDEGVTLACIRERLIAERASSVACAVLVDKDNGRDKPARAEFVGVTLPDRFLFGFGMDVRGAWRNLPAIYALDDGPAPS